MKQTDNPFEGLGIRYPQVKYGDGSIKQKAFFENGSYESDLIPLEDRIITLAGIVFEGYDLHKLVEKYLESKDALDDDTRKHGIAATFHAYSFKLLTKIEETANTKPFSDNLKRLTGKFYDDYPSLYVKETSSEEMQRRIIDFVSLVKEVYTEKDFAEQPQKPNEPVFLIRTNLYSKDADDVEALVDFLYENDIISINVRDRKGSDDNYFCKIFSGDIEKQDPKKHYINQFYRLVKEVQSSDVIVIAHYIGKNPKVGLIRQGSNYFCNDDKAGIYKLYCLKMESVQNISSENKKRFLSTLIPSQLTILPVKRKLGVIYSIFKECAIPFELDSVSDSNLEILCAEYLRSGLSYQSVRVLGGTFPDIDIIGYKSENELFAAQVSFTTDKKLIDKKIEKLCKFEEAKLKIMFSTFPSDEKTIPLNINIQDVWNHFAKDESYKKYLERLIEL